MVEGLTRWLLICAAAAAVFGTSTAQAQRVSPHRASGELRFTALAPSFRIVGFEASVAPRPHDNEFENLQRGLVLRFGLGGRFFSRRGHGVIIGFERGWDPALDARRDDSFAYRLESRITRVSLAHRFVVRLGRDDRAFTLTPHVGVGAGRFERHRAQGWTAGILLGLDADIHLGRFIMGASVGYERRWYGDTMVRRAHSFRWNALPLLHMGVAFGRPVVTPR